MDVEREERRWNGKSGIRLMIFVRIDDLFSGLFAIGAVGSGMDTSLGMAMFSIMVENVAILFLFFSDEIYFDGPKSIINKLNVGIL